MQEAAGSFLFEIDKRTQAQQGIQEYCPDPVERSYTEWSTEQNSIQKQGWSWSADGGSESLDDWLLETGKKLPVEWWL